LTVTLVTRSVLYLMLSLKPTSDLVIILNLRVNSFKQMYSEQTPKARIIFRRLNVISMQFNVTVMYKTSVCISYRPKLHLPERLSKVCSRRGAIQIHVYLTLPSLTSKLTQCIKHLTIDTDIDILR